MGMSTEPSEAAVSIIERELTARQLTQAEQAHVWRIWQPHPCTECLTEAIRGTQETTKPEHSRWILRNLIEAWGPLTIMHQSRKADESDGRSPRVTCRACNGKRYDFSIEGWPPCSACYGTGHEQPPEYGHVVEQATYEVRAHASTLEAARVAYDPSTCPVARWNAERKRTRR